MTMILSTITPTTATPSLTHFTIMQAISETFINNCIKSSIELVSQQLQAKSLAIKQTLEQSSMSSSSMDVEQKLSIQIRNNSLQFIFHSVNPASSDQLTTLTAGSLKLPQVLKLLFTSVYGADRILHHALSLTTNYGGIQQIELFNIIQHTHNHNISNLKIILQQRSQKSEYENTKNVILHTQDTRNFNVDQFMINMAKTSVENNDDQYYSCGQSTRERDGESSSMTQLLKQQRIN